MTKKDLKKLGFKKTSVSAEESGDNAFYYYTYDFGGDTSGALGLITQDSDAVWGEDGWKVYIIESGLKPFTDKKDVKKYIKLIEKYEK